MKCHRILPLSIGVNLMWILKKNTSFESTKKFEETRGITRCQKWK
jgi:hypothetical protein